MLHALRRALLLTLAILLLFASSAAAACAWVLWAKMTPQDWEVSNTYPTEAACKDTILVWMARVDPNDRLGPATLVWVPKTLAGDFRKFWPVPVMVAPRRV